MIPRAELEQMLGPLRLVEAQHGAHASPGLHERHYQPRARVILGAPPSAGRGVYLYRTAPCASDSVRMPDDPAAYAARLYQEMHLADSKGYEWIAVEPPPADSRWEGIADRLKRASR
jgi:L-threonylcarbamoyladenylate synthase